eukprot:scaffold4698_cov115-Isochrysis_galbana.AAC.10
MACACPHVHTLSMSVCVRFSIVRGGAWRWRDGDGGWRRKRRWRRKEREKKIFSRTRYTLAAGKGTEQYGLCLSVVCGCGMRGVAGWWMDKLNVDRASTSSYALCECLSAECPSA